jgi:processive 1,2-diacylglycerol beta-glucosyltransferase
VQQNAVVKGITDIAQSSTDVASPARGARYAAHARVPEPPRVLLLTSGLGSGHVRAAEAVALAVRRIAPDAVVQQLDFWTLMNPGVAAEIQQKYLELVLEHPDLYARLHRLDERTWRRVIDNDIAPPPEVIELIELAARNGAGGRKTLSSVLEWAVGPYPTDLLFYPTARAALPTRSSERAGNNVALLRLALLKWAFLRLQGRMEQRLQDFGPHVVVATQMVPAALVSALKRGSRRWRRLPLIGVLTDFGAHDYWSQPGIDRYCVPHTSIGGLPLATDPRAPARRIVVTGVPLMPGFETVPTREDARRALGLAAEDARPVVLVLGGGLGLGLDDVVAPLSRRLRNCHLVVMAGRNDDARRRMQALASEGHHGRTDDARATVHVHGWSDQMERYLAAADFVVGKSGGLTVAEVLACGRPLLVTRTLQGQESFNVRFLERHDVGRFVGDDGDLAAAAQSWLDDPTALQAMQRRAAGVGRRDGALQVAREALELLTRRAGAGVAATWS